MKDGRLGYLLIATIVVVSCVALFWSSSRPPDDVVDATLPKTKQTDTEAGDPAADESVPITRPAAENRDIASLFSEPDESTTRTLEPWVAEFRASMTGADHFDEYRILTIDDDVLRGIQHGAIERVIFNFSADESYALSRGTVSINVDVDGGQRRPEQSAWPIVEWRYNTRRRPLLARCSSHVWDGIEPWGPFGDKSLKFKKPHRFKRSTNRQPEILRTA